MIGRLQLDRVSRDGLLLLPLFVTPEEDPPCYCEEEYKGDDPDAETDYGGVVRVWAGRFGYSSLGPVGGGWRRGDRDSCLDRGG